MRLLVLTLMFAAGSLSSKAQQVCDEPATEAVKTATAEKKGLASYYHDKFEGRQTATGEVFDNDRFTAASNQFKLGSYVKVTNLTNGEVIYVRINDRMAKSNTRVIDLTSLAAKKLEFHKKGITKVKVEIVPASEAKPAILAQRKEAGLQESQL
ncbi:septal ring lytic transglycosylase RlpA family protein [Polluticoccus soli]|uniref:septal ring lytic transglycosylase RlpA family protein n=1 Tax=Polluticoccus soli TaxID=3034150 RepID=UPI0023E16C74|nr:septal ring lytic transglycosylase RlpA family protein [Flavipsychrobacter sp. JY13-12]